MNSISSIPRAYGYSMYGPDSDEGGLIIVSTATVPNWETSFHHLAAANSRRALEAYRRAGQTGPHRYLLFKDGLTLAGEGYFYKDDGPQEMATLAAVFRDLQLRLAFPLPTGVQ